MSTANVPETVVSADGTRIAFDRLGDGAPVILVEPAGHYRRLSSFTGLAPLLARQLAVYRYDRRGRGDSGDTPPYAPGREVEDLAALVARAGGSAHVYGYSSGALVAMHAAAQGVPIRRLALLEPPLPEEDSDDEEFTAELAALVRDGRNADAVEHFHRGIGVPDEFLHEMRSTPAWVLMEAVAPTLVYDCLISQATTPELLRAVDVPTLVLDSQGSTDDLTGWAASVAAQLPRARHRSLAGEWHTVPDEDLASALLEFFRE